MGIRTQRRALLVLLGLLGMAATAGCGNRGTPVLRLAVTTSTRDSGLLDKLLPAFEAASGADVVAIANGTGAALRLGAQGEVDALLVHAPPAEQAFMQAGHGTRRVPVFRSEFLLVGPKDGSIEATPGDIRAALKGIAARRATFVSRGDDSGTHKRERALWKAAGIDPNWKDYIEAGHGMARTLQVANELGGYTLVDGATWLRMRERTPSLGEAVRDPALENPYAVIVVDPSRRPQGQPVLAHAFADFVATGPGREIVATYEIAGTHPFVVLPRRAP